MSDGRDDVLHTAAAIKNTVTIVTDFSFQPCKFCDIFEKKKQKECAEGCSPLPIGERRTFGVDGVTFGTKVKKSAASRKDDDIWQNL